MIPEGDGMARFQAHHSFECLFTMHYLSYVTHMEVDPKVHFAHWDLNALYFQRLRPHRHSPTTNTSSNGTREKDLPSTSKGQEMYGGEGI